MKLLGNGTAEGMKIIADNPSVQIYLRPISRVLVGESSGQTSSDDLSVEGVTSATVLTEGQIEVTNLVADDPVSFVSLDPTIATVDENGRVERVSNGVARILVRSKCANAKVLVPVSLQEGVLSVQKVLGFASGTLGENISDEVDQRISEVTEQNALDFKKVYSVQDHTNGIYQRSPLCWASDLDLTCISPWNSQNGSGMAGTLVSPKHIILAYHWGVTGTPQIRFVTSDNEVVTRTIVSTLRADPNSDIRVGVLDSDVPETITFAKVLPDTWKSKLPGISLGLPVFGLDQEEKALLANLNAFEYTNYYLSDGKVLVMGNPAYSFQYNYLLSATRNRLYETIIAGDSGNPVFFIVNGELVILGCMWRPWYVPDICSYKTEINAAMTTLGGGYQLTEVDLSSFPTY